MMPDQEKMHSVPTFGASMLRCVRCGKAARSELSMQLPECIDCGCDFVERPPMSYARMEGFLEEMVEADLQHPRVRTNWEDELEVRLVERWLASTFLLALSVILLVAFLSS